MTQYKLHIFKTSNTFNVFSISGNVNYDTIEYLAVGGGGGAGSGLGGGGGAGGFLTSNLLLTSSGLYNVIVGSGGAGEADTNGGTGRGTSGTNTTISLNNTSFFTALGGGAGGTQYYTTPPSLADGVPGGSGGGSGGKNGNGTAGAAIGYPGPSAQGFPGGTGSFPGTGGGGGGAGGIGQNGSPSPLAGGIGRTITWIPASYGTAGPAPGRYFAGGGGGGPGGSGGSGGGGNGGSGPAGGFDGNVNTGGGGGGGINTFPTAPAQRSGGDGGSGIVVIKYPVFPISSKISSVINVSTNANTYYGDQTVTVQVTTANVVSTETLYYSVKNTSNSQVVGGNTGSFSVTSNNYVEVPVTLNISGKSNIAIQIRRNSGTGAILRESGNITIQERSIAGGSITEDGDYILHAFTASGNLTISSDLSNVVLCNVLIVGGGGGAGDTLVSSTFADQGGGGGGGGLIQRIGFILYPGNTYPIVIGSGGAPDTSGGNTTAFGMIALGGGGGTGPASISFPGRPGGSGGGGGKNGTAGTGIQTTSPAIPADSRTFGFGFPGRAAGPGNGSGGGGGGAGATPAPVPSPSANYTGAHGKEIVWVTPNYGTPNQGSPLSGNASGTGRFFAGGGAGAAWLSGWPAPTAPGFYYAGGTGWSRAPNYGGTTNGQFGTGGGGAAVSGLSATPNPNPSAPVAGNPYAGSAGGSGIVIIRYPK